jgi:hypothetical protein
MGVRRKLRWVIIKDNEEKRRGAETENMTY